MAAPVPTTEPTERLVATVERAVAVLGALADTPEDLGTNELARRTGINASTVSRVLATLARDELVRRVPATGRYRLGLRLVQLGNAALARVDLRDVARPHLIALAEATGETATLSVPGEQTAMTVDFVQSRSSVRSVAEIGRPSVPHATAIGKLYLAYGGRLPEGVLRSFTGRTITDRRELGRQLAEIRDRGWAQAIGEREDDLNAVATPVLSARGDLVAALGVQGPAGRFEQPAMRSAVDVLLKHATALSARSAG